MGPIRYWIRNRSRYPKFFQIILRIYVTHVSSASSQRDFSFVNRLVTSDINCMKDDIRSNISCLKSGLANCDPVGK